MIKKLTNTQDKKRLLTNFASLFSLQGLNFILPLITMPYLFRVLGAEKFGLVAFSLSLMIFFKVIVDYGFHLSATREISTNKSDKKKLNEIYSSTLIVKTILLSFCFIVLLLLIYFIDKFSSDKLLYLVSFIYVISQTYFPIWFFQGIEEMKYIAYLNLFSKILFVVSIFIFVQSSDDYLFYPLLYGISSLLIAIYSIHFISKKYQVKFYIVSLTKIKSTFRESWDIFVTDLMPNLYNNFSTFLLGFVTSMENVGYYSLATKIIDAFNSVLYIIRNVTFPYLNNNFKNFRKISMITLLISLSMTIFLIFTSHITLPLIFGNESKNSLIVLYIMSLSPFLLALKIVYGTNKMLILKKDKLYRNITLFYTSIGFILSIILIPIFDIVGAASTIIVTMILMAVLYFIYSRKIINEYS